MENWWKFVYNFSLSPPNPFHIIMSTIHTYSIFCSYLMARWWNFYLSNFLYLSQMCLFCLFKSRKPFLFSLSISLSFRFNYWIKKLARQRKHRAKRTSRRRFHFGFINLFHGFHMGLVREPQVPRRTCLIHLLIRGATRYNKPSE